MGLRLRESIVRVIREKQDEFNISDRRLAEMSGLGRHYLQRRLDRALPFSTEDLEAIATPLRMSVMELLLQARVLSQPDNARVQAARR